MKLLQNCWSELLILHLLFLQTTHDSVDEVIVVSSCSEALSWKSHLLSSVDWSFIFTHFNNLSYRNYDGMFCFSLNILWYTLVYYELESIQKRALKIICGSSIIDYEQLRILYNLPTLSERRETLCKRFLKNLY